MDIYVSFYAFVKDRLNQKFLLPFKPDEDIDQDILFIFKNNNNTFVKNMNEEELVSYLTSINIYRCSFYKGADYTLNRLYKKLSTCEKSQFINIIHQLALEEDKSIKNLFINDIKTNKIFKDKFNYIVETISNKNFKNPIELGKLIDLICLDEVIKDKFFKHLTTLLEDYSFDAPFINDIIKTFNKEYSGPTIFMDLIMNINYPIDIHYSKHKLENIKEYIKEVINNSKYLSNIENDLGNKDAKDFKKKYKCCLIQENHKILEEPMAIFNYISDNFETIKDKPDFNYNMTIFKIHLSLIIIHFYNIFVSISLKKQTDFDEPIEELKESLKITMDKTSHLMFENYTKETLDILINRPLDIPNIIDNFKKLNMDDKIKEFSIINKDTIIDFFVNKLNQLGFRKCYELNNIFLENFSLDMESIYDNLISYITDDNKNSMIIKGLGFISKFLNIKKNINIKKQFRFV